jgi:hypothetical protein
MPLPINPGVVVVRDQGESKARVLGSLGVANQLVRIVLFAGKGVANFTHKQSVA